MSERNRLTTDERIVWLAVYSQEYAAEKATALERGYRARKMAWDAVEELRLSHQKNGDIPLGVLNPIPPVSSR